MLTQRFFHPFHPCVHSQADIPSALIFCPPFSRLCSLKELILLWLQYPEALELFPSRYFTDVKLKRHKKEHSRQDATYIYRERERPYLTAVGQLPLPATLYKSSALSWGRHLLVAVKHLTGGKPRSVLPG